MKVINIAPERLWIYRCKETQNCSICPFSLSQTHKENSKRQEIDKESEAGKHLLEGVFEGRYEEMETLLFNCLECNQKWAVAGEVPAGVWLAFRVNKGKSYEGSNLTCFTHEKEKKVEYGK